MTVGKGAIAPRKEGAAYVQYLCTGGSCLEVDLCFYFHVRPYLCGRLKAHEQGVEASRFGADPSRSKNPILLHMRERERAATWRLHVRCTVIRPPNRLLAYRGRGAVYCSLANG